MRREKATKQMILAVFMVLLFLVMVSGSILDATITKHRFEETLPISIGWIPVVLFFGGLAFGLQAAFILVLCLAGGMIAFSVLFLIRSGSGREVQTAI